MTSLVVHQDAPVELQRHVTHVLQLHASHTIQHSGIHSLANTSCLDEEITQSTTSDHQMRERPKTCSEGNTKLDWIKGKSFAAIS